MKTLCKIAGMVGACLGMVISLNAATISLSLYDAGYVRGPSTREASADVPQVNGLLWASRPEHRLSIMSFDLWQIAQNEGVSLSQIQIQSATLTLTRGGQNAVSAGHMISLVGNFDNQGWDPDLLPGGESGGLTYNNAPKLDSAGNMYFWERAAGGNAAVGTLDATLVNIELDVTGYLQWAVGSNQTYQDQVTGHVAGGLTNSPETMLLFMLDSTVGTSNWRWWAHGMGAGENAPVLSIDYVVIPEPANVLLSIALLVLLVSLKKARGKKVTAG